MLISDICSAFERIAPLHLAQDWDNVGLLAGDERADCRRLLLCIDLTHDVLDEAVAGGCHMIMAYHPPVLRPITSLRAASPATDAILWRAIRENIAVYSMHTALDAAPGGTNDVLAGLCAARDLRPFEYSEGPAAQCKIVVFVLANEADRVAGAMAAAGAGVIGAYTRCSFRIPGTGTFLGGEGAAPAVGEVGRYETVDEIRLEMIAPRTRLPEILAAMRAHHSYEEPAFDIYPLIAPPRAGIGRIGRLEPPVLLQQLADRLRGAVGAACVQQVGAGDSRIERVAVCAGSAGSLVAPLPLAAGDCVVTGELGHHIALALQRRGASAVVLGHWASERPVLAELQRRLTRDLASVEVRISRRDRDPFDARGA